MLAQLNVQTPRVDSNLTNPDTFVGTLVSRFLVYAIALSGMYLLVKLTIAGFIFLTSQGDAAKVEAAQKTIVNSLIGLVIVISGYFIAQILQSVLGINFAVTN